MMHCCDEGGVVHRSPNQRGLTIVESLIALCAIAVLISIVVPKYQRLTNDAREAALKTGLMNIRTSIELFKILNRRCPKDLAEMTDKNIMLPARSGKEPYAGSFFKQKYLMMQVLDAHGNYLDAFGSPYLYNAEQGTVRSTTPGYGSW